MNQQNSNIEQQHIKMTQTPIPPLVTSMAVPTVTAMLITVAYNTADTYFVAQINKSASAAVGAVYTVMAIIQALGYGIGVGAGSLISRNLGAKREDKANMYASSGLFASVMMGVILMVGGLSVLPQFMRLLGCTDTMMPYAIPYARFILIAAPINCAVFVLNNTLRSQGKTKLSMIGMGAGGILNIFLDPLFIFKLGMGTGGAALATMISQTVSFVILTSCYVTGKSIVDLNVIYKQIYCRIQADYHNRFPNHMPTGTWQSCCGSAEHSGYRLWRRRCGCGNHYRQQGICSCKKYLPWYRSGLPACCRLQFRRREQKAYLEFLYIYS